MADAQIVRSSVSAIPAEYVLPGAADFLLKAVQASFDGSGAGGAFLPCVSILSDSGHVVARAIDTAVSVAAGGSAEVSFFPGVKHAAAAAGGAVNYILLFGVNSTVTRPAVGDNDHAKFNAATAVSNNAGNWTFLLDGGGNVKEVDTTLTGGFLSLANWNWAAPVGTSRVVTVADIFGASTTTVSFDDSRDIAANTDGIVAAFSRSTAGTAQFDVNVSITAGDASLGFIAPYWAILNWA
jgi:hypothetical protein